MTDVGSVCLYTVSPQAFCLPQPSPHILCTLQYIWTNHSALPKRLTCWSLLFPPLLSLSFPLVLPLSARGVVCCPPNFQLALLIGTAGPNYLSWACKACWELWSTYPVEWKESIQHLVKKGLKLFEMRGHKVRLCYWGRGQRGSEKCCLEADIGITWTHKSKT